VTLTQNHLQIAIYKAPSTQNHLYRTMAKLNSNIDFQETQLAWTAHMRDPLVSPPPENIEERRLIIYRELIFNNIDSFLKGSFPILHSLMSAESWQLMVRDFIIKHQAHSPYFLEISQEFLHYLNDEQPPMIAAFPFALELAHYEWVELALDVSPESFPLNACQEGDLLEDCPLVSPLAWRLSYQYPVHNIGPEYQPQTPPDEPTYLVVYRDPADAVKFMECNAITIRLLQLLEDGGCSAREALTDIASEVGHPDTEFIVASGLEILKQLQALSILCGFRK
jgi:uncharacterized protein